MPEKKYIIGIDIGGTTFSAALFDEELQTLKQSERSLIADYTHRESLTDALADQAHSLFSGKFSKQQLLGVGISCPGPLDARTGVILDTPNLTIYRNYAIAKEMKARLDLPVVIENDANLFAMGEWVELFTDELKVLVGITLGSGTGFGIIINGDLFTGAHGMGAEYGISPVQWGRWEEGINIKYLMDEASSRLNKPSTPAELCQMADRDDQAAQAIWSEYGHRVGLFLAHAVNMLDPDIISIGGGISNAWRHFQAPMLKTIARHAPAFDYYGTRVLESAQKEFSSIRGAAMLVKKYIGHS